METGLTQLGIGGIFALMVLTIVFNFMKGRNNNFGSWCKVINEKMDKQTLILERQTEILLSVTRDIKELRRD